MQAQKYTNRKSVLDEPFSMEADADIQPPNPEQSFIIGGISAAQHSNNAHKGGILADVAHVLGCSVEALGFLIDPSPHSNSDFDFPDAERRRFIGRENHLNIAE
ncbi:hypothetical protein [Fretibacter rubidus]|uniref:hypothetical protein n=1 Tax=Fretibacter rubidus TaxID=570162 RepID=UPI00352AAF67